MPTPTPTQAVMARNLSLPWHRRLRWRSVATMLRSRLKDQRGSQITDNLGLIVIGIVAVVAVGGLISGLDTTVFKWLTTQLGLG